jgi:hypothetical protein
LENFRAVHTRAHHRTYASFIICHSQAEPWLRGICAKDGTAALTSSVALDNDLGMRVLNNSLSPSDTVKTALPLSSVVLEDFSQRYVRSTDGLLYLIQLIF